MLKRCVYIRATAVAVATTVVVVASERYCFHFANGALPLRGRAELALVVRLTAATLLYVLKGLHLKGYPAPD